jgi:hypothetical protein
MAADVSAGCGDVGGSAPAVDADGEVAQGGHDDRAVSRRGAVPGALGRQKLQSLERCAVPETRCATEPIGVRKGPSIAPPRGSRTVLTNDPLSSSSEAELVLAASDPHPQLCAGLSALSVAPSPGRLPSSCLCISVKQLHAAAIGSHEPRFSAALRSTVAHR